MGLALKNMVSKLKTETNIVDLLKSPKQNSRYHEASAIFINAQKTMDY